MHILETNDWVIFNNITCQIHKIPDFDEMCRNFLEQVRLLMNFDAAVFYYSDFKNLPQLKHVVCYNYNEAAAQEYLKQFQERDYSRGLLMGGKKMVYRESDVFSDEERMGTECYRRFFQNEGYHHSVHILPAEKGKVLAKVSFFRRRGAPDFVYDDVFLLDMFQEHLALRIQRSYEEIEHRHEKLSVSECESKFHLTTRETTILGLLIQGLPNDAICTQLTITNNTLKKHILNIYKKMAIRNRTQLFKMVREYAD
ncbi:MAG: helix-turn-helix transcriptional regulator [Eubacteriales bacterium]|nr:helix-turn-helix transcriptional regulator [Eubacteriales bacterium]